MRPSTIQTDFLSKLADPWRAMFIVDYLPHTFFFMKDLESRLIVGSRSLLKRLGVANELDFVGKSDDAFFEPQIAEAYRKDDAIVFRTAQPLVNRLEVCYDEHHEMNWFLTTKMPLFGSDGSVIGLAGITSRDEKQIIFRKTNELSKLMDIFHENAECSMTTAEIAKLANMSERTFFRKVNQLTGVSPHELLLQIRIQRSAEVLLRTNDKIANIASRFGFCDQSTFIQHFRKRTGMTPREFRQRHQS